MIPVAEARLLKLPDIFIYIFIEKQIRFARVVQGYSRQVLQSQWILMDHFIICNLDGYTYESCKLYPDIISTNYE